jgi:hypothetical protein
VLITLILERDHIISTIKAALGGHSEQEKLEPISYRTSWAILAISYILLMVFFLYTGFSLWMSFVLPLSGIITWFIMSQLWGRIGFMTEPCYNFTPGVIKMFVLPTVVRPKVTSTDIALAPHMSREWIGHQSITGWGDSLYTILASYRMTQLTNINQRNVLKVVVATIFVSMFVTEIIAIAITGVYGWGRFHDIYYIDLYALGPVCEALQVDNPAPPSLEKNYFFGFMI